MQHGGQPPHFLAAVQTHFCHRDPAQQIGPVILVHWPPGSPDINRLDVYMWGHIKAVSYQ